VRVFSACPLSVTSMLWQPRPDAFVLTVICKATFTLQPGKSSLSAAQNGPSQVDAYWEESSSSSIRTPNDHVPFKRRIDVLAGGHVYAPHGPVTSLVARFAVAGVNKSIEVYGDRFWTSGELLSSAIPFTSMPLRWERTAGGPGTGNPVGLPANARLEAQGPLPAPNLLPFGVILRSSAQIIPPVNFGPMAPTWPERVAKLGRHAAAWDHKTWAEKPLPRDMDAAYFNAASPDQQLERFPLGEQILLEHLHPEHPRLMTVLEEVIPCAMLHRDGMERREVQLRCDTMWIDTDQGTCALTWRGTVPLRHPAEEGMVIVTAEHANDEDTTRTLVAKLQSADTPRTPLVSAQPAPQLKERPSEAASFPNVVAHQPVSPPPLRSADGTETLAAGLAPTSTILLPFQPSVPDEPFHRPAPPRLADGTETLAAALAPVSTMLLPFRPTVPNEPSHRPAPLRPADGTETLAAALVPMSTTLLPFRPTVTNEPSHRPNPPSPPPPRPVDGTETLAAALAPVSAMLLPFRPTVPNEPSHRSAPRAAGNVLPARPDPLPSVASTQEQGGLLPLPIDAAIQVEIWQGTVPLQEVLARHGVTEITWRERCRRWKVLLQAQSAAGKFEQAIAMHHALLKADRDRAETTEIPLSLEEYARIHAEIQHGGDDLAVLAARGLDLITWRGINRIFRKCLRADAALSKRYRDAKDAAIQALTKRAAPSQKHAKKRLPPKRRAFAESRSSAKA
jgi:hypothetical protein